ncbi:MAG: hypothetical protein ABEJ22_08730 [Haloferacaceae archaeon]
MVRSVDPITWMVVYRWSIRWMSVVLLAGSLGSVGAFWVTQEFRYAALIGWSSLGVMGLLMLAATGSYYMSQQKTPVLEQRYL